jgi:hypothetical protein
VTCSRADGISRAFISAAPPQASAPSLHSCIIFLHFGQRASVIPSWPAVWTFGTTALGSLSRGVARAGRGARRSLHSAPQKSLHHPGRSPSSLSPRATVPDDVRPSMPAISTATAHPRVSNELGRMRMHGHRPHRPPPACAAIFRSPRAQLCALRFCARIWRDHATTGFARCGHAAHTSAGGVISGGCRDQDDRCLFAFLPSRGLRRTPCRSVGGQHCGHLLHSSAHRPEMAAARLALSPLHLNTGRFYARPSAVRILPDSSWRAVHDGGDNYFYSQLQHRQVGGASTISLRLSWLLAISERGTLERPTEPPHCHYSLHVFCISSKILLSHCVVCVSITTDQCPTVFPRSAPLPSSVGQRRGKRSASSGSGKFDRLVLPGLPGLLNDRSDLRSSERSVDYYFNGLRDQSKKKKKVLWRLRRREVDTSQKCGYDNGAHGYSVISTAGAFGARRWMRSLKASRVAAMERNEISRHLFAPNRTQPRPPPLFHARRRTPGCSRKMDTTRLYIGC